MIEKLVQTVKAGKYFLASVIAASSGLSKWDKNLSRYGLSEKQIESFDYESEINEHLNQFFRQKIIENTTEEENFMAAWERLSFSDRNLMAKKSEFLGETNLAKRLSEKVIMFSDILKLPDSVIKKLLEKADYNILKLSLADINENLFFIELQEKVREKIYANMEQLKMELLKEDLYFMGPVRKQDIIEARKKICASLKVLVIR